MAEQIIFNSEELEGISTTLNEFTEKLEGDVKEPLNNDFKVLTDLEFYSEGLKSLIKQVEAISEINKSLVNKLKSHDESLIITENKLNNYVTSFTQPASSGGGLTSSESPSYSYSEVTTDNVSSDKTLNSSTVTENKVIFTSEITKQLLTNLSNNKDTSLDSILLGSKETQILTTELKNILNKQEIDSIALNDQITIKKEIIESIANLDDQDIVKLEDKSVLTAIKHFKKIANENKITVSDLLLEEKYNKIFLQAISDIYKRENLKDSQITEVEIDYFIKYLDNLAKSFNTDVNTMLKDETYIAKIKEGINV